MRILRLYPIKLKTRKLCQAGLRRLFGVAILFPFIVLTVCSAEPERVSVDTDPVSVESASEPVSITLTIDPQSIPPELAHLLKYLRSDGVQCEVGHSDPGIVAKIWQELESEFQDFSYLYKKTDDNKPFRILSLDGGGIRGLVTCIFLSHLTHITGKPVHELFDMIVATSTGTLIAAGLGTKKPDNYKSPSFDSSLLPYKDSIASPYFSPEELAALYLADGKIIFSGKAWFSGWSGPKYTDSGINGVLLKYFKDVILSDLAIPVVLTSYDLHKRTIHPFCSFGDHPSDHGVFVREAVRACVAAPTYFSPVMVYKDVLCDAGIVKNNPASLGVAIAAQHFEIEPTRVALFSLGCGHCVDAKPLSVYQSMGITGWAEELLSGVMDGQVDHEILFTLHKSGAGPMHYLRVSPLMDPSLMSTDDTTSLIFDGLSKAAISEIHRRYKDFARLAEHLTGEKPHNILPEMGGTKPKAIPMSISLPFPADGDHPLIQQFESSPVLSVVDPLQPLQTEPVVLGGGSTPPSQEPDQPTS